MPSILRWKAAQLSLYYARFSSLGNSYTLLSIVDELRVGTSPRPVMAARLIIPRGVLVSAGMQSAGTTL